MSLLTTQVVLALSHRQTRTGRQCGSEFTSGYLSRERRQRVLIGAESLVSGQLETNLSPKDLPFLRAPLQTKTQESSIVYHPKRQEKGGIKRDTMRRHRI
ncbi:Hypothetical predicted protein [Pelobates cultripes]|uniref:Uncharacterized protein n=1 Tax=Pelobates cultripes TaxID=61616 RepID=A0AAD1S985_PELCU|nr:Hypothetical predicted protein [Pelobates cultripes]